jgi:MGT family glycosyltransferase
MSEQSTRPAHIAVVNDALHGHVRPSLAVVQELMARGHRVTYAVPRPLDRVVAPTGAELRIRRVSLRTSGIDLSDLDSPLMKGPHLDLVGALLKKAGRALRELAGLYEGDEPDLVLGDSVVPASRALAHAWGVPHIQLTAHSIAWEGYYDPDGPGGAHPLPPERVRAAYRELSRWLRRQGAPSGRSLFSWHPGRALVMLPRMLQPHADRVDERLYTFVGTCYENHAEQGNWKAPTEAEKVLLVSFGSLFTRQPDLYRECVRAFGDLPGWHVVLQTGGHMPAPDTAKLPRNVEVRPWVPQLAVLRQADLFVTHAGAGGAQEGLATGTPMICVPLALDQPVNAAMLESLGVARVLPPHEVTAAALRTALEELTGDPAVAERCRTVRARMCRDGGAQRAADIVEAALRDGSSAVRPEPV